MREEEKARLVIVQGPTASGKSALALELAERIGGEIVNADSMQVYRGMDIGTAKPSQEERRRVPHHLYDIVDPDVNFTAADFREHASRAITEIGRRGKRVVLVGGTGLYIRILTQGLVDSPGGDDNIRRELEDRAHSEGLESLHRRLAAVDPVAAARLHPNDGVRIVRALEVFLLTGRPLSAFQEEHRFADEPYRCLKIGISVERELLYRRVEERVDRMIAEGLVEEVRGLLSAGYPATLKAMGSIGYREICAHLAGGFSLDEAVRLIKQNTRQYAKRQMTWFRRDSEIIWVEYPGKFDSILSTVMGFYH
ncbi:tRNA (adenosine(37)-N6)-dimethylallyltransferase MiaA [Geobacter hydrogenophilus]|uniref:tRNA dimethylallyltransferase n=1 Tax=Geobacter hydrogenophilus TaxID=40983 RepID=A0A9W6G2L3_9BACT|nr:tRNA (adenosine(37)-N6)-dimethylallyltransferase MiaA [Geobacter hydrogenophilus]MBT0895590.1 tRNA (adenosine(37)-N6)-dimethylallyltransferase MiaA [Geobacter hydrogenophilus]GLI39280.1 tRNA dimethylallyltransferase [Geobacter hydrogenophilus]